MSYPARIFRSAFFSLYFFDYRWCLPLNSLPFLSLCFWCRWSCLLSSFPYRGLGFQVQSLFASCAWGWACSTSLFSTLSWLSLNFFLDLVIGAGPYLCFCLSPSPVEMFEEGYLRPSNCLQEHVDEMALPLVAEYSQTITFRCEVVWVPDFLFPGESSALYWIPWTWECPCSPRCFWLKQSNAVIWSHQRKN